jgi:hypothetical protein
MPVVAAHPTLRDALAAYVSKTGSTKADAAATLGVDPMTLARFLKSGKVIEANRAKIEAGLARIGEWHPTSVASAGSDIEDANSSIISSDKVIAALEFLLSAAREARLGETRR